MNTTALIIKGAVTELSEEDQAHIKATYNQLKSIVDRAELDSPGCGIVALALLAAERTE